jgi:hypothetical protein
VQIFILNETDKFLWQVVFRENFNRCMTLENECVSGLLSDDMVGCSFFAENTVRKAF